MIVALLAEKSGVGQRALLVDADRQGSSRFSAQTHSHLRLPRLDSTPLYGEMVARQIATVASGYDDVVIDTGAADERDISGHNVSCGFGVVFDQPHGLCPGCYFAQFPDTRMF